MRDACYFRAMSYWIKKVDKQDRKFRIGIPLEMIREKGWESVRYVRLEDQWGDRIMITRVSDDEDVKEENTRATRRRD